MKDVTREEYEAALEVVRKAAENGNGICHQALTLIGRIDEIKTGDAPKDSKDLS